MEEIKGKVISKIYEGADGYAVVEIAGDEPAIVVGIMPHIKTGEATRFFGEFKTHPRFGRQFVCQSYESVQPVDPDDMVLFLASDFVKGMGDVLSQRVVDTFGAQTFEVIEKHPDRLLGIKGISAKLAQNLHETFLEYAQSKYRYTELMGLGLSAKQAQQAAEVFGGDGATIIRENPYVLAGAIRGIDFITADKIATGLGFGPENPLRAQRAVMHVLKKLKEQQGYMCVPENMVVQRVQSALSLDPQLIERAIQQLCLQGEVILRTDAQTGVSMVFQASLCKLETQVASMLMNLKYASPKHIQDRARVPRRTSEGVELSEEQRSALRSAWNNAVSIITGGPGTGKTTIIRAALAMFGRAGLSCKMAAPTGRAAKRMEEATGQESQTIHRLLEYTFDEEGNPTFRVNEKNPLDTDVLIVDEVSMVDAYLFRALLRAIKPGTRLILIGDADQLPSVGAGNILRDLISSECINTIALTHRYRNAGLIAESAYKILSGEVPDFDDKEFMFVDRDTEEGVRRAIGTLYQHALASGDDVQVIAPVKQAKMSATLGSIALNNMLREAINPKTPDKNELTWGDRIYREGDRVMQIVNDYQREWINYEENEKGRGVYNGDIGSIRSIRGAQIQVMFDDGRLASYTADELNAIDGAFAYTIHKSQGSEFATVIMPMLYPSTQFLSRSLLYTGVTRAKKRVVLVGSRKSLTSMVRNDLRGARYTGMVSELRRLQEALTPSWHEDSPPPLY